MKKFNKIISLDKPTIYKDLSGLTTAIWRVPDMHKKIALISSPLGSLYDKISFHNQDLYEIPAGTAHFLEHKIFENEDGLNVFDSFANLGASCNAYTSSKETNFSFSTSDNFIETLELLLELVQNLYLTNESFQSEKKIIEQEILMYDDHPGWRVYYNLLQGLYHQHPIKNDIAGSVESLNEITIDTLHTCHKIFYHPQNLILSIAGDIEPQEVKECLDRVQTKYVKKEKINYEPLSTSEERTIKDLEIKEQLSVNQALMYIGFKINNYPPTDLALLKKKIAYSLLLDIIFGKASEAFYKLYDQGLLDDSFGTSFSGGLNYGHVMLGGRTDKPENLKEALLKTIKDKKTQEINNHDLIRAKKKMWGGFVSSLNSLEVLASQFIYDHRRGTELMDTFNILEEIKSHDLGELLSYDLTEDNLCTSVIEPLKAGE